MRNMLVSYAGILSVNPALYYYLGTGCSA